MGKKKTRKVWTKSEVVYMLELIVREYKRVDMHVLRYDLAQGLSAPLSSVSMGIQNMIHILKKKEGLKRVNKLQVIAVDIVLEKYGMTRKHLLTILKTK